MDWLISIVRFKQKVGKAILLTYWAAFDQIDLAALRGRALALSPWPVHGKRRTLILSEVELQLKQVYIG